MIRSEIGGVVIILIYEQGNVAEQMSKCQGIYRGDVASWSEAPQQQLRAFRLELSSHIDISFSSSSRAGSR
jgi:hypothetical protein